MTPPAIGIDARKIRDYGIGRYLEGLLRGLARIGGDEHYVLFLADGTLADLPGGLPSELDPDRFRAVRCVAPLYSWRELLAFRGVAGRHRLDLLHFPHYARGFGPGCPVAVTIHDPIHLVRPPSPAARLYARAMMPWSARSAAVLFTVSNTARDELAALLRIAKTRFVVTPNGIGPPFRPPDPGEVARFRGERSLEKPFVLCVASHRPHKNLAGAAEGFRRAGLEGAELIVPARDEAAARRIAPLRSVDRPFRILEGVTDEDLPLLYAAARIVLAPSRHEGFGLPALEAAACGGTVLATGIPAHREVLGNAAAFAESGCARDLAHSLAALWNDAARRSELASRGPARAALFPWEETARRTRDAYWNVLARNAPSQAGSGLV